MNERRCQKFLISSITWCWGLEKRLGNCLKTSTVLVCECAKQHRSYTQRYSNGQINTCLGSRTSSALRTESWIRELGNKGVDAIITTRRRSCVKVIEFGMVTKVITNPLTDTLPVLVIKSAFSLLPLGRYLLSVTTQNRYQSTGSTGRERLIRSHSSARFCFELSGNLN